MKQIAFAIAAVTVAATAWAGSLKWETDYDAALKRAKLEKKLVMVDVYTDWCGWCKKLDKDVYANSEMEGKLNKGFVVFKTNPEKSATGKKLAQQFGTTGFPHIVFTDATGKKVDELRGYAPADKFGQLLDKITAKSGSK